MAKKKVAIVGSGCAGLGAAWALKDTDYEIHLFESEPRLGGHTNTQPFSKGDKSVDVDTGFIVMNTATYPNFIRFLKTVGVEIAPTAMTFSVSRDHGKFEWSGDGRGLFAQRKNIFRLRHWRMIYDIVRFNQYALDLLVDPRAQDLTIGEYLRREGYSQAFCDDYLIPMTAAVWSTSPDKASLEFPAQTLIRFLWNHHLLSTLAARPDWLTIPGGSQKYIDAIVQELGTRLHTHLSSSVVSVTRPSPDKPAVTWVRAKKELSQGLFQEAEYRTEDFDHVIMACHGDQILPILEAGVKATQKIEKENGTHKTPSKGKAKMNTSASLAAEEKQIFSAFKTTENTCYLHSDLALMPTRRDTWSSWNYLINTNPAPKQPAGVSLTYNMNILQHIPEHRFGHVLVTMNPDRPPKAELTQGTYIYRHPLYTVEAVRAQEKLNSIQGQGGVSYCGAWTKYGFHEDGFSSGLKVAMEQLGAKLPFQFVDSTYSRGQRPQLGPQDYMLRVVLSIMLIFLRLMEVVVALPGVSSVVSFVLMTVEMTLDKLEGAGLLK